MIDKLAENDFNLRLMESKSDEEKIFKELVSQNMKILERLSLGSEEVKWLKLMVDLLDLARDLFKSTSADTAPDSERTLTHLIGRYRED